MQLETIKDNRNSPVKYAVLIALFVLPLVIYLLSASGEELFNLLPQLTKDVSNLEEFEDLEGNKVSLDNKITILGFFGDTPESKKGNALNLNEKIYKRNYKFDDFQFVILISEEGKDQAIELRNKIKAYTSTEKWIFAVGSQDAISNVFNSLKTDMSLSPNYSTPYVFIIDKEQILRGRENDEDNGLMYGYNSADIAEISNKMVADVKVILAEYRRALKKYNSDRK